MHELARFFTQHTYRTLCATGTAASFVELAERYTDVGEGMTNAEVIERLYALLSSSYRNEYFYQNTLFNTLLLGVHTPTTTTALAQLHIQSSIADLVLVNGEAVVYEIKSELDNLDRLDRQIEDYYSAFSKVCIVAPHASFPLLYERYKDTPIGIRVLTKKNTISRSDVKHPVEDRSHLTHRSLFSLLRKAEYEQVVATYFGSLPNVSHVEHYRACYAQFCTIEINEAYPRVMQQLRARRTESMEVLRCVPYPLRSLAYFSNKPALDLTRLSSFLESPYAGVNACTCRI